MSTIAYKRETSEFDRSLSFFDAVYAFSLTLLIANLDVPAAADWANLDTLLGGGLGDQLLAFVISLFVIEVFWRNNQSIVSRFARLDSTAINLNILLAAIVIFIPFTTQAIGDPATSDLTLPTVVYAINVAAAILAQIVMYRVAVSHALETVPVSARQRRLELINALYKPMVFLVSIPVALAFGGDAGKLTWLLILLSPLVGRLSDRLVAGDDTRNSS